jgi:predicted phosphodiesterase
MRATGVYPAWIAGDGGAVRFEVASRTYSGKLPTMEVPRFDGAWHLNCDALILNDIHIPATNWAFAEQALQLAEAHLPRPRTCVIAGDLVNGDALSRWDNVVTVTPLADELEYAEAFLNHLAGIFDQIYMTRGNHENRILFGLRGQLHAPQFRRMFTDNPRVHFSMYSWLRVTSGGQTWHITHQRGYSQSPLSVARKLATKHGMPVISAHQHQAASGRDISNRFACIDSGGLHDAELMAYIGLEDGTAPVMANGFVLLRDGIGTLFTPEEYCMTDWSMWLESKTQGKTA